MPALTSTSPRSHSQLESWDRDPSVITYWTSPSLYVSFNGLITEAELSDQIQFQSELLFSFLMGTLDESHPWEDREWKTASQHLQKQDSISVLIWIKKREKYKKAERQMFF